MKLCDYGCGQEAKYPFKNGKWCCEDHWRKCPIQRQKVSMQKKKEWNDPDSGLNSILCKENQSNGMKEVWKDSNSKYNSISYRKKKSNIIKKIWEDLDSKYNLISFKEKLSKSGKLTIEKINIKYPFFSKIEEMRYNPDKPGEKEIQVHCKNHECENSKEKDGWFTPTFKQIADRKNILENEGVDRYYFYCSQHCKDTCILFGLKSDPYKETNLPYTYQEYQACRSVVFEREKGLCEYCGEPATDMHHIYPVKKEPFFALDPDYCVACCEKHHYEYAHKDECSTGNLSKIVCSVESQKFLNQK